MTILKGLILSSIFKRRLHVISRSNTMVKPASPTPPNLKHYNLPINDIALPSMYTPYLFLYPNINSDSKSANTISNQLKKSLSETLSKFYPFAGRLQSRSLVDCNDGGADFAEARIGCKLSDIMGKADHHQLSSREVSAPLFPPRSFWSNVENQDSSLVRVQINHFDCGGIAIAAALSHRLGDGASTCSFLCYWANITRHSGDHHKLLHLLPHFELRPALTFPDYSHIPDIEYPDKYWITKDLVFHNTNLEKLKARAVLEGKLNGAAQDQKYTRIEVLTALLYRCFVSAAATAKSKSAEYAASVLCQSINIRRIMDPPLPDTAVGNLVAPLHVVATDESETKVTSLVAKLREKRKQLNEIKRSDEFEIITPVLVDYTKRNHRVIYVTSICNYPLYKEMDFGWGRPAELIMVDGPVNDCISFTDTASGDGIKACVNLQEEDMKAFQNDPDLLTYASLP